MRSAIRSAASARLAFRPKSTSGGVRSLCGVQCADESPCFAGRSQFRRVLEAGLCAQLPAKQEENHLELQRHASRGGQNLSHGGDHLGIVPGAGGKEIGRARMRLAQARHVGGENHAPFGIGGEKSRVVGAHSEPIPQDLLDRGARERRKRDSLAARPDRRQEARAVVADEDENRAARRLLEDLQERVLRILGERLRFLEDGDLAAAAERLPAEEELHGTHLLDQHPFARRSFVVERQGLAAEVGMGSRRHLDARRAASAGFVGPPLAE